MNKIDEANEFIKQNKAKVNPKYRLKYHLMGEYGWINDPNGFIQYKGNYHLFYQHYPYDAVWGPMHWGHAISKDLVKWFYLPLALAPEEDYDRDGCFSGSAIEKNGKLYLFYTGHIYTKKEKNDDYKQVQNMAISADGIAFEKYEKNPIIDVAQIPDKASKKDFRDPRIFKIGDTYYLLIGSNDEHGIGQVLMYKSIDLIKWEFVNILLKGNENTGINWECPDIIRFEEKDILLVSAQYMKAKGDDFKNTHSSIYFVGRLDIDKGKFEYENYYSIDYGFDFYAPQTTIDKNGRIVMVAWMDMWETDLVTNRLGHNWAGAMTLPREVIKIGEEIYFKPISEIVKYRKNEYSLQDIELNGEVKLETNGICYEIDAEFEPQDAYEFGVKVFKGKYEETVLSYNCRDRLFTFNRDRSGIGPKGERKTLVNLNEGRLRLRVFVDVSSVEVFINEGEEVMTGRIYPDSESINISIFSVGECRVLYLKKWDIDVD
ncbi:sucrose-6-phosphate hydrolase [Thermoanaerobacterium thermosaccharolyticum]|uniref:Sucrose-6-phosphate hydrolase n=1 Tax=Thermoanaerobacterium thermosaccharolyticum TaxID=1517 RepID=A0A231VE90_THETR|nr:glycoside hydrolase family 32 protein [Thermoanaerobacterium thermosaccharolyticum]OXT05986.1 sucrose-6-phosphate hydrolase [Thermoanaerobacterium thermosaccharolyticum]